jgi:hypothetical protein
MIIGVKSYKITQLISVYYRKNYGTRKGGASKKSIYPFKTRLKQTLGKANNVAS